MAIDANETHPEKALLAILVVFAGIVIDVNISQFKNALLSILATFSGIEIDSNEEHTLYLQPIITQYFASNKSEIWP